MIAYKLGCTRKIHVGNDEKWTMCYTDLADIVDDCDALNKLKRICYWLIRQPSIIMRA